MCLGLSMAYLAVGALVVIPVIVTRYKASATQLEVRRGGGRLQRACTSTSTPQQQLSAAAYKHPASTTHNPSRPNPQEITYDSPALAALAGPHGGSLDIPAFVSLVRREWAAHGLADARPLSDGDLAALARRAGFVDALNPQQPPLRPRAAAKFAAWLHGQLSAIEAAGHAAFCCRRAQLICGFTVGRAAAEAALVCQPPGTFCLRLGSPPASLVLSLVQGRGRVQHFLFGVDRLRHSGLARAMEEVPGAHRLLDVASGRAWRPSIVRKELARSSA